MIFEAILRNNNKPGYGQVTVPFPILDSEYDHTIALLEDMDIGSPTAQDCRVDGLDGSYPILDQLVTQTVNVDELDYLAKRLDSFCQGEIEKFQAMASKLCLSDIKDFINLTFCCQLTVEIKSGPEGEVTGHLYLPCPDRQIQRTLFRAGSGWEGFRFEITTDELPPQVSSLVSPDRDGLEELNALCRAIEPLNAEQREKLDAVVLLARPECASEVCQLAENLDQFDFVPKSDRPEVDSALTELGYVAYHGSLTLEELMMENPAEQYQQEQEMGGMA